jgi:uncharacterized membrane protein
MDRKAMAEDLKKIRFVAANYSNLQGLKSIPIGLLVIAISLWVNLSNRSNRNLMLPLTFLFLAGVLYIGIAWYYRHTHGWVRPSKSSRYGEILFATVFSVLALLSFAIDTSGLTPYSTLGIVFALGLLGDFLRFNWPIKGKFLIYYPLMSLLLVAASILPAIFLPNIWQKFGFADPVLGILALIGVLTVLIGILGHIFLRQSFPFPET